jgi:hypothetical protein
MVIVFTVCAFLKYWAWLYKEEDAGKIKSGAQVMMAKASEMARALHVPSFFFFFLKQRQKLCLFQLIKKKRIAQLINGKPG